MSWEILPLSLSEGQHGGYLLLNKKVIEFTLELVEGIVFADISKDNDLIGIEILYTENNLYSVDWVIDDQAQRVSSKGFPNTSWTECLHPSFKIQYVNDKISGVSWSL